MLFDVIFHLMMNIAIYADDNGISGQIFFLISSFLSNRQLQVVLDGKYSHEYPVNAGVPQGSIPSSKVHSWSYTFPTIY